MEEETSGEILGDSTGNIYENLRQTRPSSWVNETRSFYQDPPELSSLIADSGEQCTLCSPCVSRNLWKKLHNTRGNKFPSARGEIFLPLDWPNVDPFLNFFPVIDSRVSLLPFFFFSFYFKDRREILRSNAILSRCRGLKREQREERRGNGKLEKKWASRKRFVSLAV